MGQENQTVIVICSKNMEISDSIQREILMVSVSLEILFLEVEFLGSRVCAVLITVLQRCSLHDCQQCERLFTYTTVSTGFLWS